MTLTKISAVTAALAAILNVAVLLGVDLTGEKNTEISNGPHTFNYKRP